MNDSYEKMKSEILDMNIRIVEFMGGVYEFCPIKGPGYRFSGKDMNDVTYGSGVSFLHKSSLSYDANWNHLMAVAAKIKLTIKEPEDEYGKHLYNLIFQGIVSSFSCQLTAMEIDAFLSWQKINVINKQS